MDGNDDRFRSRFWGCLENNSAVLLAAISKGSRRLVKLCSWASLVMSTRFLLRWSALQRFLLASTPLFMVWTHFPFLLLSIRPKRKVIDAIFWFVGFGIVILRYRVLRLRHEGVGLVVMPLPLYLLADVTECCFSLWRIFNSLGSSFIGNKIWCLPWKNSFVCFGSFWLVFAFCICFARILNETGQKRIGFEMGQPSLDILDVRQTK